MISHRSDLIAVVIEDVQSSICAHAKEFAIQLPANRERLRAFWRMLYESRRTRAFTHSRMARARFNADPWPSTFDESIPPDAVVGVTRQGPIGRSSASFLRCPAEVRLGSIAPLANPSANDRYLRIPAEDWSRRKDKARSVGGTCRHAVMANCRIAQARRDISENRRAALIPSVRQGQVGIRPADRTEGRKKVSRTEHAAELSTPRVRVR